ncbi:DNA polymerase/3'-5' exonuclease PolX [Gemmatimonadetes bacterium T265]|nr:DNA polymerase/3'-5' exonuclease PolX [Gemmatimonadetes bacterium T265]
MDSRAAADALERIGQLLELRGDNPFKTRAYHNAARALTALDADDLALLLADGTLDATPGLGPGTLAVVRDLVTNGRSNLLDQLAAETPAGLAELLRVPGLGTSKIHQLHTTLGVDSLDALERAARDGTLAGVKGFGAKTAEKIAQGVAFLRANAGLVRFPEAAVEAARLVEAVRAQPGVAAAQAAGEVRRRLDVVGTVDVVAAAPDDVPVRLPAAHGVAARLTRAAPARYAVALWRATGNDAHVAQVAERLAARGYNVVSDHPDGDAVRDARGAIVSVGDEAELYALAGMSFVVPELREGRGEVEAAAADDLPALVEPGDLRGVLHCHTTYSDGGASVAEMAEAARARGWSYVGITDHSQSAAYAGGLTPAAVVRQHGEIDRVNDAYALQGVDFRVLKGIECDILADGELDYDERTLARFEFVIGSVHSRFGLARREMTDRVCRAVANPFLTVLGHPTGRLLLQRDAYAVDLGAVVAAAAEHGAAVELNADPHRLDLDWRELRGARDRGVMIEIGPDAHSPAGLANVEFGVGAARKGWLGPADVLNARDADAVLAFARAKREGGRAG